MKRCRTLVLGTCLLAAASTGTASASEGVVASIKPVHSLVAAVMEGVGQPALLVEGAGSPHAYSMRPSQAAALEKARLVFWIGRDLETFLEGPLETLAQDAAVVTLSETEGLTMRGFREGGPFEAHAHEGDEHAQEDDGDDHDHAHEEEEESAHAHGGSDMHLWLDPLNARAMVHEIEEALSGADPDNAERYAANADSVEERLDALVAETEDKLSDVRGRPFVVFHDAYQYYELRFDVPAAGSITVKPETAPGARRVGAIRDRIAELGAVCVFSEPQFEPQLVEVVTEGTQARSAVLDPLGAELEDGPGLYFRLIENMTSSLKDCLTDER